MTTERQSDTYSKLSPKMALQLAAPHTWPASIMSVFIACGLAWSTTSTLSPFLSLILLVICALMQSSVNTFNDYFDFIKGTDTADDNVEESDSTLVYNNINPRSALILAIVFLMVAFLMGIPVIVISGFIPLIIAAIGAVIVVLYSGGKTPISYLPIGEAVSGFVMGGLIPLACYQVLTGSLNFFVLLWSIPSIAGVGLIMMTNNTCDIEKDLAVKRYTLPARLGRLWSKRLYNTILVIWIFSIIAIVAIISTDALFISVFMLLASFPFIQKLWQNPLNPRSRIQAMVQICTLNVVLGAFYTCALFL